MSTFGDRVRKRREEKKISLRGLARQIGISGAYLSKMERGMDSPPGPETIKKIALALDLDVDVLFADAKKIDPEVRGLLGKMPGMPSFLRTAYRNKVSAKDLESALDRVLSEREKEKKRKPGGDE